MEWVKDHSNILRNKFSDQVAKGAAQSNAAPWVVDLSQQTDIMAFAYCYEGLVELELRQLLSNNQQFDTARIGRRKSESRESSLMLTTWNDIPRWLCSRPSRRVHLYSSIDTSLRTHQVKKLHLPTLNSMQARQPILYQHCRCRRCDLEDSMSTPGSALLLRIPLL